MKTVAVIGAGISGLAAAHLLSRRHRVHLFEQESRLGGHTNTVLVEGPTGTVPLDTGFLVHNDRTYPNLVRLFGELGVATRDSDMSFAVSCRRTGLEYSSRGANGFFAQRRNLVRPSHLSLLREIVRFNREAPALLTAPDAERQTLGDFLESRRFGEGFTHRYLFPMASAIWSASLDAIRSFPALTLIRFFDNHGLLSLHAQPTWKVVAGGSHTYIPKLIAQPVGRHSPGRVDSVGAATRGRGHADLPRSAVDAVRRGGVRVPRGSGAAAARRSERSRARRVLVLHDHDQRRLAAHGLRRCCPRRHGPARRGTTGSPATPMRRRRSPTT